VQNRPSRQLAARIDQFLMRSTPKRLFTGGKSSELRKRLESAYARSGAKSRPSWTLDISSGGEVLCTSLADGTVNVAALRPVAIASNVDSIVAIPSKPLVLTVADAGTHFRSVESGVTSRNRDRCRSQYSRGVENREAAAEWRSDSDGLPRSRKHDVGPRVGVRDINADSVPRVGSNGVISATRRRVNECVERSRISDDDIPVDLTHRAPQGRHDRGRISSGGSWQRTVEGRRLLFVDGPAWPFNVAGVSAANSKQRARARERALEATACYLQLTVPATMPTSPADSTAPPTTFVP
jgi:hypothetical protein